MRSLMIGMLLEIIINSKHIITNVTPLNINFSDDSGGSQKTDSVRSTITEIMIEKHQSTSEQLNF